jgi:hypothetical protein
MRRRLSLLLALCGLLALASALCGAGVSAAAGLADEEGAEWRLEQPAAPEAPPNVQGTGDLIGLGEVSDVAFESPDRGALITAGNGETIKPGVWLYNGARWAELSDKCGASNRGARNEELVGRGRIVWTGPDEFWTVSDGRPGQADNSRGEAPPLEDDTLCRFAVNPRTQLFEIATSYASLAFQSDSYQAMSAAACIDAEDCWFGGELLPEPQAGSFQLHWNGHTLAREPNLDEGHQIGDMASYGGHVYESVRVRPSDPPPTKKEGKVGEVPALHLLNPNGSVPPFEAVTEVPLLASGEFPSALDYLSLSADEEALWAAAGPQLHTPKGSSEAGVTVLRYSPIQYEGGEYVEGLTPIWAQLVGPCPTSERSCESEPPSQNPLLGDVVKSIAAEPGTNSAWLGLDTREDRETSGDGNPTAPAIVARVAASGQISDEEPLGAHGATEALTCPGPHDCWLVTTQGWLFHLATAAEREHPQPDGDPAFSGEYLITERPADEGVPQEAPTEYVPEEDESNAASSAASVSKKFKEEEVDQFATITLPVLSDVHSRLIDRTELELTFKLSVKARVRLLAKRKGKIVASTAAKTMKAGKRSLEVRLDIKRWPTKLELQTHRLEALKTISSKESSVGSITTSMRGALPTEPLQGGLLGTGWPG